MAKVKHIALFKFKEGTSEEQVQSVLDQLLEISDTIPGIEDYVAGTNNSPEGLSQGFTHGFVMSFADAAARDAYLTHPDHEKFKAAAIPNIDAVTVFDFEV